MINKISTLIFFGAIFCYSILLVESAEFNISYNPSWAEYKEAFGKNYQDLQIEKEHEESFLRNSEKIRLHNEAFARGEQTFQLGYSPLTDLTESEWKLRKGFKAGGNGKRRLLLGGNNKFEKFSLGSHDSNKLPKLVDWRKPNGKWKHPLVTPVKDQGDCGSCWTFSATGILEAAHAKATGKLLALSEQNFLDCDSYSNDGCNGGDELLATIFAIGQGGLATEMDYPYVGNTTADVANTTVVANTTNGANSTEQCKFNETGVLGASMVKQIVTVPYGDELALKTAVAKEGPISVAIQVTDAFSYYKGGVLNDLQCSNKFVELNHAVLLVGYGTDPKFGDYWLVKNSWGEKWGENGYIRMARNKNNQCGIATEAFYVH